MNILLINHYAGSSRHGMVYRHYYLAREWVRLGHHVQIVASSESHLRSVQPNLGGLDRLDENIDGIHYTWLATSSYIGNSVSRAKNMISFVGRLYKERERLTKLFNPDVVISSSTYNMDIWPAHRIAKISKAKLIFEVRDLWPLTPIELGRISRWNPFIMLVQKAEDYAYHYSDAVISVLPKTHDYMKSRGMALDKLHIVPNGIDPREWNEYFSCSGNVESNITSDLRTKKRFIVGYTGNHGLGNALGTLVDSAKLMQDENVLFVLIGDGPDKVFLQERARIEGIDNVFFLDPVQKSQIPGLLELCDILYIGSPKRSLYRFGISPNKLMDYMMASKPVLMAIDAGNDPVKEAGCGLTIEPDNPQAVAVGIRNLLALTDEERATMGKRGQAYVLRNHAYPVLAQRFLEACV